MAAVKQAMSATVEKVIYAKRHAASTTHPRRKMMMAAVKQKFSTEEVCSGNGSHSRKGDGWGGGDNSVFGISCDQFNVIIIIY